MNLKEVFDFYKEKNVLVTGHTGFKGTWLSRILVNAGANVTGYSLNPPTDPALFDMSGLDGKMNSRLRTECMILIKLLLIVWDCVFRVSKDE